MPKRSRAATAFEASDPPRAGRGGRTASSLLALAATLLGPASAPAWLVEGHRRIAVAAVEVLPVEVPATFRESAETIGQLSKEPDVWKNRATVHLRDGESPEHYLDIERFRGAALPELRSAALRWIGSLGLDVGEVGLLPWAIVEESERLTLAFAELRRWPGDEAARVQALAVAGRLAHYGADLVQPLHTTIHHDGWALPDDSAPRDGTHFRIDGLLEAVEIDRKGALDALEVPIYEDPVAAVRAEFAASHALVDRTYEIDRRLVEPDGAEDPEVVAFACERYRAGVRFVAGLMRAAWEASARIELPEWLER